MQDLGKVLVMGKVVDQPKTLQGELVNDYFYYFNYTPVRSACSGNTCTDLS